MKIFRRVLGGLMMAFNIPVCITFLINLFVRFDPNIDTAFNICIVVVYGLFAFLGYKIFGFKKAEKPAGKQAHAAQAAAPAAVPAKAPASPEAQPAGTPVRTEPVSAPKAPWAPRESCVLLYRDDRAVRSLKGALLSLSVGCVQGVPRMSYAAGWSEGRHGGTAGDQKDLPADLIRDLSVPSLMAFIRDEIGGKVEDPGWNSVENTPGLEKWVAGVRKAAGLELPGSLYMAENPFAPEIDGMGPDGMNDRSGVRLWLGVKQGADLHDAVGDLITWQEAHRPSAGPDKCFILIREDYPAEGAVTPETAARCEGSHIGVATLRNGLLRDYVTGTDLRLYTCEHPGSADDAATYGEWDLIPEPKETQPDVAGNAPAPGDRPAAEEKKPDGEPKDAGMLDDVTFIRDMRSGMSGPWHQYDILLAARPYGWAAAVDWAAYMASADIHHIGTVTAGDLGFAGRELIDAFRENGEDLKKMQELEYERGFLAIGGSSRTLSDLVKIVWINQTNTMRIFTMQDQKKRIRAYAETAVRRTFGTPDAMKAGRPIPEKKA